MSKNNVIELTGRDTLSDPLTELLRTGAGQLIYQAVEAELQELLTRHSQRRTEDCKAGVVHNGYLPERELHRDWGRFPGSDQNPEGACKDGGAGAVPLSPGAAVCA